MLKELFGGKTPEQVLLYLENYEEGYGKAIADTFEISLLDFRLKRRKERQEVNVTNCQKSNDQ
jgi:hypothetical protein